jgi:integrase/recombinase XerD
LHGVPLVATRLGHLPMIEAFLEEPLALSRHRKAPLLTEREQFLSHLLGQGTSRRRVRSVAAYLIHIVRIMELTSLRGVEFEEIKKAAECWANYRGPHRRKQAGKASAYCFSYVAKKWLRFHGRLIVARAAPNPFSELISEFEEHMRTIRGLSPDTIRSYGSGARVFLRWLAGRHKTLSSVSLHDVDDFLARKAADGWRPTTLATQGQALRAFFGHAGARGWCAPGIDKGIQTPRVPKYDGAFKGPKWKDVRRLLESANGTNPVALRARAILLLHSIYALRSSEVRGLRLNEFDWREERFAVHRAKRGGVQYFPIQYEVGEAILRYLTKGRPRCACRHVFVTLNPPYRPLTASSMWQITSLRMKRLGIMAPHCGPHALRHACATHLLRKGTSLKEIADFLGHRDSRSIGLYAKYDPRSLRMVAAFHLAGLR